VGGESKSGEQRGHVSLLISSVDASSLIVLCRNQAKFAEYIYADLKAMCESGNLGPCHMVLLYGLGRENERPVCGQL
jgi:hypothetical protein